jgi:hypothetical protein
LQLVARWNPLSLKVLMIFMGVLIVVGSALGSYGASFFPFDKDLGVSGIVAGVAFGAGIVIAGFNPEANVSWVRAVILYCIIELVYEIVDQIAIARFDIVAFLIALIVGGALLFLYPNKQALFMSGSNAMPHKA